MLKRRAAFIACAAAMTMCALSARAAPEIGGSDYVAIGLNPSQLTSQSSWRNNAIFQSPSCFTIALRPRVLGDMRSMFAHGQRKIAINIWHADLHGDAACQGYILNTAAQEAIGTAASNVREFADLASNVGFDEIQVRFLPQWKNSPTEWTSWDQAAFDQNLRLVVAVSRALRELPIKVTFDLGGELGGIVRTPSVKTYVQRMWATTLSTIGPARSYGFSIAYAPGRVKRTIDWLREAGAIPSELALDVYASPERAIVGAAQEARAAGIAMPVFVIQESFYNDVEEFSDLTMAADRVGVRIRTIMQWPKRRGATAQISEGVTLFYPSAERPAH